MTDETRHGVDLEDLDTVWEAQRREEDERDARDFEQSLEAFPEEEHERMRRHAALHRERRWWVGDDWPRPDPGTDPDSVAVVGFGAARTLAPYGEPGWELWCLNDPHEAMGVPMRHAFTRWFQIHPPRYLAKHYPRGLDDLRRHWGEPTGVRLYMDRHYDEYPDSEPYPKEAVEALTGHGWWHASSFDWMIALAIHEGFRRICVAGVEFWAFPIMNGEPISALPCLAYWAGVAEGRGIELDVRGRSGHLFQVVHLAAHRSTLQYGWDREPGLDLVTDGAEPDRKWRDVR